LKGKTVCGFGNGIIVLHDRSWWKLVPPIPNHKDCKLEICGRKITEVDIKKNKLELTLLHGCTQTPIYLYLRWTDDNGNLLQPEFPVEGQSKIGTEGDEEDWKEIDDALDTIEALLDS